MTYQVDIHPDYKPQRMRPFKAYKHMQKLLENNEDTEQVFHIMDSLNGDATRRALFDFARLPKGQDRLKEKSYLPDYLDNHNAMTDLEPGSVGRAYIDFMKREGLTANGLVEESERFIGRDYYRGDDIEYMSKRLRDTHDLFHILSGYGRDQLGETALLCFSYGQYHGKGGLFIAYLGTYDLYKQSNKSVKLFKVLSEARKNGKAAQKIHAEHIPTLLRENLHDARKRLGIKEPVLYKKALEELRHKMDYEATLSAA